MNSRTLVSLIAALVVLVALAVAASLSQRSDTGAGELLLPGLKAQLNDVEKIVVRTAGDKVIATLDRQKAGWTLAERNGYAADVGRIRKNLIALAEARVLEEKTSNPELYGRLGVDDIEKESAGGVRLDLSAAGKTTSVIIGNTGVGGGERAYARRAGEATSWLVSGALDAPRESAEWLDRGLTDIAPGRVRAVTIAHPDGPVLRLEKPAAEGIDFAVLNIPSGRELSFPTVGNPIGAALSGLTLDNVEPAAGFAPGDVKPIVARFETSDGLLIEVSTWKLASGQRVRFSVSADQALADRFAEKPADAAKTAEATRDATPAEPGRAAEAAPKAETRRSFEEVKAEADELNERLGNWVYTLPDFKGEQLTRKIEDLLQPKPPGK